MLIILYGTTGEMGHISRQYFREKGYEVIQKINYVPDTHLLNARFEPRKLATLAEVRSCDFVYEHGDGITIGFNKEQILDALWGRKNCLISFATENIDFIHEIKSAYADTVTVIGTYIESENLSKTFSAMAGITPEEHNLRMKIGRAVKKNILDNRHLFDDIIIYSGDGEIFDMDSLKLQYDTIMKKAAEREERYRNKTYVEMPYSGPDPYVFISYCHKDEKIIYPILAQLQSKGMRIWFDKGIQGGENWRKIIASKIVSENCAGIILFCSESSVDSIHVEAEINCAINCNKKIIPVRLDDKQFGMHIEMYITINHNLSKNDKLVENIISAVDPRAIIDD